MFDNFLPVDWEANRKVEETDESDTWQEQLVLLEGAIENSFTFLTLWSQVLLWPRQARSAGGDDRSSGRLLHEADRQRPGCWSLLVPLHPGHRGQVMYELTICIAAAIDADVCNLYLVEQEGQLSVFPHGSGSGWLKNSNEIQITIFSGPTCKWSNRAPVLLPFVLMPRMWLVHFRSAFFDRTIILIRCNKICWNRQSFLVQFMLDVVNISFVGAVQVRATNSGKDERFPHGVLGLEVRSL